MSIMDAFVLNEKWRLLYGGSSIKILRIDAISIPDMFIGIDSEGFRCLTLKTFDLFDEDFKRNELSNLSIEYLKKEKYLVIRVLNEYFWDLFNDFIVSIYNKIYRINNEELYVNEFLKTFYRWSEFFDDKKGAKVSEEIILGLFGELFFIKYLITCNELDFSLEDLEKSWVGPYDKGHDFEFLKIDYEVKTKSKDSLDVNISSEYQLQEDVDKFLELVVIDIEKNFIKGISLKDLVNLLKDRLFELHGDFSFIIDGLKQKNINFNDLEKYDNFRYNVDRIVFYDCLADDFPRLFKQMLSPYLSKVRYQIRLSSLSKFIKLEKEF